MANPNNDQVRQTREALLAMADSLGKIFRQKGAQLSDEDIEKLKKAVTDTLDAASAANASAIQDTADNIQKCVNKIADAKKSLDAALNNLEKVKNVPKIVANVAKLSLAVTAGDVQTIIGAAGEVMDAAEGGTRSFHGGLIMCSVIFSNGLYY